MGCTCSTRPRGTSYSNKNAREKIASSERQSSDSDAEQVTTTPGQSSDKEDIPPSPFSRPDVTKHGWAAGDRCTVANRGPATVERVLSLYSVIVKLEDNGATQQVSEADLIPRDDKRSGADDDNDGDSKPALRFDVGDEVYIKTRNAWGRVMKYEFGRGYYVELRDGYRTHFLDAELDDVARPARRETKVGQVIVLDGEVRAKIIERLFNGNFYRVQLPNGEIVQIKHDEVAAIADDQTWDLPEIEQEEDDPYTPAVGDMVKTRTGHFGLVISTDGKPTVATANGERMHDGATLRLIERFRDADTLRKYVTDLGLPADTYERVCTALGISARICHPHRRRGRPRGKTLSFDEYQLSVLTRIYNYATAIGHTDFAEAIVAMGEGRLPITDYEDVMKQFTVFYRDIEADQRLLRQFLNAHHGQEDS